MPSRQSHHSFPHATLGLLIALVAQVGCAWARTPAEQVVADVRSEIANGDCKAAVAALNKGLGNRYPEVQLLAASLYEHGVCLKASWGRAENLYLQAYKNGQKAAAYRLAAGYAAPENGPNMPAALWWANRAGLLGEACLPAGPARDDAEKFVAELPAWPESRLATCNYAAGVMSAIIAEVRYPTQALQWSVDGEVVIAFNPAAAEIAVTLNGVEQRLRTGLGNGDRLWERDDRPMGSAFKQAVRTVADRAVQRYPKPAAIPAGFPDAQVRLVFTMADPEMPNWHN